MRIRKGHDAEKFIRELLGARADRILSEIEAQSDALCLPNKPFGVLTATRFNVPTTVYRLTATDVSILRQWRLDLTNKKKFLQELWSLLRSEYPAEKVKSLTMPEILTILGKGDAETTTHGSVSVPANCSRSVASSGTPRCPPKIGASHHQKMLQTLSETPIDGWNVSRQTFDSCTADDKTKSLWLKSMTNQGFLEHNGIKGRGSYYKRIKSFTL